MKADLSKWRYTPVKGKAPFQDKWQKNVFEYDAVQQAMRRLDATGYGIVLGEVSGGVVAIDFDGPAAIDYFTKNIMDFDILIILNSVSWTSNKPGRLQVAFNVDKEHWDKLKTKKITCDEDYLEFRWNACQSVLPPSMHPDTGKYEWLVSPDDGIVKQLPAVVLEWWKEQCVEREVPLNTPAPMISDDAKVDEVITIIEFLSKHNVGRNNYDLWRDITYAVAYEVGVADAKAIMTMYYPPKKTNEYNKLLRGFDRKLAQHIGSLMHYAQQIDPKFAVSIVAAEVEEKVVVDKGHDVLWDVSGLDKIQMPFDNLPKEMRDAIDGVQKADNIPREMSLISVLAFANFAAQRLWDCDSVRFGRIPCSDFFVLLQERSGGKTTIYKKLGRGVQKWVDERKLFYAKAEEQYAFEIQDYKNKKKKWKIGDVIPSRPERPAHFDPWVESATLNGLINHLTNVPVAGLFTDEGATFINSYDNRNAQSGVSLAANLSKAWGGSTLKRDTGLDKTRLDNRRLNMFLMVQKDISAKLIDNRMYEQQGLDSRLLFVDCPRWEKLELTQAEELSSSKHNKLVDAFNNRLYDMLNVRLSTSINDNCELDLPLMGWEDDVNDDRREWNNSCIKRESQKGLEAHYGWLSKAFEHTVRLAVTLAAFKGLKKIDKACFYCAIELVEFFFQQRVKFVAPLDYDDAAPSVVAEEDMKVWIGGKFKSGDKVTRSMFANSGKASYRKLHKKDKRMVVSTLLEMGVLEDDGTKLTVK